MRVIWSVPNVGPYHHARFNKLASAHDIDIIVMEIASKQGKYPWSRNENTRYRRKTLFEEAQFENLSIPVVTSRALQNIHESAPDVVVVNGYASPWDLAIALYSRMKGRMILTTFDSTEVDRPRRVMKERLKGMAIRNIFDGFFCAGKLSHEYILKFGVQENRIQEGVDVVDNRHFEKKRRYKNSELPEESYFLSVARFTKEKNLLSMLDAYDAYCNKTRLTRPWPLVMCGSGPLTQEIRRRAQKIKSGRIIFPGFLSYQKLPEVYQRAGCLILPSLSEPWGLVANEAMAAGIPVAASNRCGCVPELVHEGKNGFVFDPQNTSQLTALMMAVAVMTEKERRIMGRRGKAIVSNYTPESWSRSFLKLLQKCGANMKRKKGGSICNM